MRLSDERINFLSHHIISTLVRERLIDVESESAESQEIKKLMIHFIKSEDAVDQKVRDKIASIKRGIPEHSREWDVLYEQYYSEEMNKLK